MSLNLVALSPTGGSPGETVTFVGSGFSEEGLTIQFSGNPPGSQVSANIDTSTLTDTFVQCHVPEGALTGPITITTDSGSTMAPNFAIPLVLGGIAPSQGPPGATVTMVGSGFGAPGLSVVFSGSSPGSSVPATVQIATVSDTEILFTVPAVACTGPITVQNGNGMAMTPVSFTVVPPVAITTFSPASAHVGDTITITGSGFGSPPVTVSFGGVPSVHSTALGETQVQAIIPAGAFTGPIVIQSAAGTAVSADWFVVVPL
jgi:hypothetical protein